ncbi:WD40/YVTN repeat-like-containing domain superfamily [Sesbania bispinosa]|nr:WD40/YVTN repeat-like-containing domain superfamily [Sesbania bispinosa]
MLTTFMPGAIMHFGVGNSSLNIILILCAIHLIQFLLPNLMGIMLQSLVPPPPYRLNKYKRYESHGVSGFPVKCNFSLDGKKLASGSSDGSIYLYDYQSSKVVKKIKAYDQACIDVAFHPVIPNVIASCSWDGSILVFE